MLYELKVELPEAQETLCLGKSLSLHRQTDKAHPPSHLHPHRQVLCTCMHTECCSAMKRTVILSVLFHQVENKWRFPSGRMLLRSEKAFVQRKGIHAGLGHESFLMTTFLFRTQDSVMLGGFTDQLSQVSNFMQTFLGYSLWFLKLGLQIGEFAKFLEVCCSSHGIGSTPISNWAEEHFSCPRSS